MDLNEQLFGRILKRLLIEANQYEEVQSSLFRGARANARTSEADIAKFYSKMVQDGWGEQPPVHGRVLVVDEQDVEDYLDASLSGRGHELDWSRPLVSTDVGQKYVHVEDGHNRAMAARLAGIPIRVRAL